MIGVLVIGDVMNDLLVSASRAGEPAVGAGPISARVASVPGGSAANLATWLAAAGVPVRLAARVGMADADAHRQALTAAGVDARLSVDSDRSTGAFVALVGHHATRSSYLDRGANSRLDDGDLPLSVLDDIGHLHVSAPVLIEAGSRDAVVSLWAAAADSGLTRSVDLNTADLVAEVGPELLEWSRGADIVFAHLADGRAVAGTDGGDGDSEVVRRLLQHYPIVVLKLSPNEAVVATRTDRQDCPPTAGEAVDPTGAGDAFDAGFLAAWLDRAALPAAAAAATEARSIALGVIGGRPPSGEEAPTPAGIPWEQLRVAADQVSARAFAPYSGLNVGAAGLTDDGRILAACNVENASFGLSLCAECGLVSALRSAGAEQLVAVCVVAADGRPLAPCGRCRQILLDNGGPGLLVDRGPYAHPVTLAQLLPGAFDAEELFRRSAL